MSFDVIVIGSGFGGAITACRLAQSGAKVLILERGRRWDNKSAPGVTKYPEDLLDPWIWDQEHPEFLNGWTDLRMFKGMSVVVGAGVGGGSLIYANVSIIPPDDVFKDPWPAEITAQALAPYFQRAGDVLDLQYLPEKQNNPRVQLLNEAAVKLGAADRVAPLPIAVSFDKDGVLDPAHPPTEADSKAIVNKHGAKQGTCVHLGRCDFGCPVKAKNTLDVNYLFLAEKTGLVEIRPLHMVTRIEPQSAGYRVSFDRVGNGLRIPGSEDAGRVVIAAGSMGSTELLFRCRDQFKTLPRISRFLGKNWSSNGDFLTSAFYQQRLIYPRVGPTISSGINFLDRSRGGQSFIIENGGIPNVLDMHMQASLAAGIKNHPFQQLISWLQSQLQGKDDAITHLMPWFANGVDAGDGEYRLKRSWWIFGPLRLDLKWDITKSIPAFQTEIDTQVTLADKTGGVAMPPPWWKDALITPHPLGGCNMGTTSQNGVVDHTGEVFGYKGLYVMDGAIVPTPLGVNPSRTISALAERAAEIMVKSM
ncbi:MAG TPA: GMC oxidoreductase [Verrucomicrobiae bacterium]|nr:GMC oxidoreductase [Verrucomicrobiae bacterium]